MSQQENYINLIIDDLIKKTVIDIVKGKIKFPFHNNNSTIFKAGITLGRQYHTWSFKKYAMERYGVRDEELDSIWDEYEKRLIEIIY